MSNIKISAIYEKFIQIGQDIALQECTGGYPDKEDCSWYHGNWMLLRYLGVVSNPYWHEDFYRYALKYVKANDKENFLVAGTADFSMPLFCSEIGVRKIHICDICETPLKICNLVSEYLKYDWTTFVQDICIEMPLKYDIIINDAFLSRFIDKITVLKGISNSIKKGGYYITTLKQGKWNSGGDITDLAKESFVRKVKERYDKNKEYLPSINIDEISKTYINKMSSFPVLDEKEIYELFNDVGLNIIYLEKGDVEGEFEASNYFRIISQKQ